MQQRIRDVVSAPFTFDYFQERLASGWVPVAVEWSRPVTQAADPARETLPRVETPYGFRVGEGGNSLEPDPEEIDVLYVVLEQIVQDRRFTQIADELNRRRLKQRTGNVWTSSAVFEMLPQLIEAGPYLVKSEQWARRRQEIVPSQASTAT